MSETANSDFLYLTDQSFQIVSFNLGNEELALKINDIQEIIKIQPFTDVPLTKDYVRGVVHVRGSILPVIDLRKKLGFFASELTNLARIIIINLANRKIGLIVDNMNEVIRITEKNLIPKMSDSELERFTENICIINDRIITILKTDAITDNK